MIFFDVVPIAGFLTFIALLVAKVAVLKKNGIQTRANIVQNKASRFVLYLLFLPIALLIMIEIAAPASKTSLSFLPGAITDELFDHLILNIAGTAMILASLLLFFIMLRHFKNSLRFGFNEKNLGKLITNGVFSISRNPFFLSVELYFIGVSLLIANIFFLTVTLLAILAIHFFILKEEKFMLKNYGDEYRSYFQKTARYFQIS